MVSKAEIAFRKESDAIERGEAERERIFKAFQSAAERSHKEKLDKTAYYGHQVFEKASKAQLRQANIAGVRLGMDLWDIFKPILIGGIIIIALLGFGLPAIMTIFKAMNIWLWVGIIFLALIIYQNI